MKEITMITTCEITHIIIVSDDTAVAIETAEDINDTVSEFIKQDLGVDDVNILKNQLFIHDLPDQP